MRKQLGQDDDDGDWEERVTKARRSGRILQMQNSVLSSHLFLLQ